MLSISQTRFFLVHGSHFQIYNLGALFDPPKPRSLHSMDSVRISPFWNKKKLIRHKSTMCIFPDPENEGVHISRPLERLVEFALKKQRRLQKSLDKYARRQAVDGFAGGRPGDEHAGGQPVANDDRPILVDENNNICLKPGMPNIFFDPDGATFEENRKVDTGDNNPVNKVNEDNFVKIDRPSSEPAATPTWVHPSRDKGVSYSIEMAKARLRAQALKKAERKRAATAVTTRIVSKEKKITFERLPNITTKAKDAVSNVMEKTQRCIPPFISEVKQHKTPPRSTHMSQLPTPPITHAWPMPPEYEFDRPNYSRKRASKYVVMRPKTRPIGVKEKLVRDEWNIYTPKKKIQSEPLVNGVTKSFQFAGSKSTKISNKATSVQESRRLEQWPGVIIRPITVPRASTSIGTTRPKLVKTRNIKSAGPISTPNIKVIAKKIKPQEPQRLSNRFKTMLEYTDHELISFLAGTKNPAPKLGNIVKIQKPTYIPHKLDFGMKQESNTAQSKVTFTGLRADIVQAHIAAKFAPETNSKDVKKDTAKTTGLVKKKKGQTKPKKSNKTGEKKGQSLIKPKPKMLVPTVTPVPTLTKDSSSNEFEALNELLELANMDSSDNIVKTEEDEASEKFRLLMKNSYVYPYKETPASFYANL